MQSAFQAEDMKKLLRPILFFAGLAAIAYLCIVNWDDVRTMWLTANIPLLLLATITALIANVVIAELLAAIFRENGLRITRTEAMNAFFLSQVAKYVPGKVWQLLHQHASIKDSSLLQVTMSNIQLFAYQILLLLVLGCSILAFLEVELLQALLLSGVLLAVLFCTLHKQIDRRLLLLVLRRLGLAAAGKTTRDWIPLVSLLGLLHTVAIVLFIMSMVQVNFAEVLRLFSFNAISWSLAALTLLVPSGIGVKEGLFVWLATLTPSGLSIEQSLALALAMRLWLILQDLLGLVVPYLQRRLGRVIHDEGSST